MSKNETQIIKGLAIFLMIFLHLFNNYGDTQSLFNFISINNNPLVHILSRAANPVSIFLICGGYGLYSVYKWGNDKNHYKRIFRLYITYWLILLIFVPVAHFLVGNNYPGTIKNIIYNITGLCTTWNPFAWFLLPYSLLSLSSKKLFALMDKFKTRYVLIFLLFLYLSIGFILSRYGEAYIIKNIILYLPILYLSFMFAFYIGVVLYKKNILGVIKNYFSSVKYRQAIILFSLLILICARCIINTSALNAIYSFLLIVLFLNLYRPSFIDNFLMKLGNVSMEMWLVHSWYSYSIFKEEIYSLKYPLLLLIVMLAISYYSGVLIKYLSNLILNKIYER